MVIIARYKFSYFALTMLAITVLCVVFSVQVVAQQTVGLQLTPAISEHIVEPGKSKEIEIQVTNTTGSALPIRVSLASLEPNEEIINEEEAYRFRGQSWITLLDNGVLLAGGETKTVKAIIEPPIDAAPGGHYATLFFEPVIFESQEVVRSIPKVASLVLITIPGQINESAQFSVERISPLLNFDRDIKLRTTLENIGTTHLLGQVKFRVLNGEDLLFEKATSPTLFLPNTRRAIETTWNADFPVLAISNLKVETEVTYGSRHTVTKSLPQQLWIMPNSGLLAGLLVMSVLTTFVAIRRHRVARVIGVLLGREPGLKRKEALRMLFEPALIEKLSEPEVESILNEKIEKTKPRQSTRKAKKSTKVKTKKTRVPTKQKKTKTDK